MGFAAIGKSPTKKRGQGRQKQISIETCHAQECEVCPLGHIESNPDYNKLKHPHMEPTGSKSPEIYMLGEAPGADEDKLGKQFVGKAGALLRLHLPKWVEEVARWNNTVRTRPPGNRTPTMIEIECCRPSVQEDIEQSKPIAVFGFGNVPLQFMLGQTGITKWSGRYLPVKVGKHTCWFFPMLHPSYVSRSIKYAGPNKWRSDTEFVFMKDMQRALDLLDKLPPPRVHTIAEATRDIEIVTGHKLGDLDRVRDMIEHCWDQKIVGYDYETAGDPSGIRPYNNDSRLLSVGLASKERTIGIALDHKDAGWTEKQRQRLDDVLKDFIYNANCRKVVHALAFEQEWTAFFYGKHSLRDGLWGDTMSQAYILDERIGKGKPGCHSLEFLCLQYFGLNVKAISNLDRASLDDAPLDRVLLYQGIDARYHRLLYLAQHKRLLSEGLYDTYKQHLRRVPTMVLTQLKGIPIHQPTVEKFYKEWWQKKEQIEEHAAGLKIVAKFKEETGKDFRISANHDVKKALLLLGHNADKVAHVDEKVLAEIKHPLAKAVLDWREANKLLSTYVLPLMRKQLDLPDDVKHGYQVFPDGRLHPATTTTKTRTWRTASEDINYQNFPKREHKEIRSQVKAPEGYKLVSFDYGQIQARNVAMESKDKALVKAFWDRYDIHHDWTERIIREYPQWMQDKGGVKVVMKDKGLWKYYRDRTKNEFVFPSFFGAQPKSLAGYLGMPQKIIDGLADEFWAMFPHIKDWQEELTQNYYRDGYTTSLAGHRRHAPVSINELINAPIQADEAAIVCDAMARLSELDHNVYQANMEIHDDLTFIWPRKKVDAYAEVVIDHMVHVPFTWAHNVPIVVEMSIGDDWANKTDVEVFASDKWNGKFSKGAQHTVNELTGSWDDGTGWANARVYEHPSPRKGRFDEDGEEVAHVRTS